MWAIYDTEVGEKNNKVFHNHQSEKKKTEKPQDGERNNRQNCPLASTYMSTHMHLYMNYIHTHTHLYTYTCTHTYTIYIEPVQTFSLFPNITV